MEDKWGPGRMLRGPDNLEPSINVASVADCHYQDDENLIGNLVDDSVVSDSDAVKVADTAELLASGGTGIVCEPIQATPDAGSDLRGQLSEHAFCGGLEANLVGHARTGSETELSLDLFPGDAALFFESLPYPLKIDSILERANQLEVAHRHDCRKIASSPSQDDSLATVDDSIQRIRELLPGLARAKSGHGRIVL